MLMSVFMHIFSLFSRYDFSGFIHQQFPDLTSKLIGRDCGLNRQNGGSENIRNLLGSAESHAEKEPFVKETG